MGIIIIGSTSLLALVACGAQVAVSETGGGGGGTSSSSSSGSSSTSTGPISSSSSSSSTGSTSTTSSSSSSSTSTGFPGCAPAKPLAGACAPGAACTAAVGGSTCLSQVNQAGSSTPGLRMSSLKFSQPSAFTTGIVSGVIGGAVAPADAKCNLNGSATFSWLLRFDLSTGVLTTGGSKPALNSAGPYAFMDQTVTLGGKPFHIQPVKMMAPVGPNCAFDASGGDVLIPLFLDAAGTSMILLPLRSVSFSGGQLSSDLGCIGRYNAEGLEPINSCLPDATHPDFLPGANVTAFMSLEDADAVVVSPLNQSLCVLLSQNAAVYGDKNSMGVTVCKRDAATNKIIFQGDWCSATNQAASGGCADAVRVQASFAAQGVLIQ